MPSLNRAYGIRGAVIAISMAVIAGAVHGVMAASFDFVAAKIAIGLVGAVALIIGGAVSARQSLGGAIALGLAMGVLFFVVRWICWAAMVGKFQEFAAVPPWEWPVLLDAAGISGFWVFEAVSMCVPSMLGCLVGQERRPHAENAGGRL